MRDEGWEKLLYQHIDEARSSTFIWGQNDCALWCSEWVKKATGKDFGVDWRGKYTTEAELLSLMHDRSYSAPTDIAHEALPQKPIAFASRGDIVLHPQGCLGICDGMNSYFLMVTGLTRLGTSKCRTAWKV